MRFFSNEAKDNVDDETGDRGHDTAAPTVPQQRAGSPWQHDTEPVPQPAAAGTFSPAEPVTSRADDDPERTDRLTDRVDDDPDRTDRLTDRVDDDPDRTDRLPDTGDRTVAFEDGAARDLDRDNTPDRTEPVAWPAPTVPAQGSTDVYRDDHKDDPADEADPDKIDADKVHGDKVHGDLQDEARKDDDPAVRDAIDDRGTFDDPHLTQPIPAHTGETPAEEKADDAKEQAVVTETKADEAEPLVPVAATPAAAASGPAPFFPAADTQVLREQWRDVQLRFVDDPKGATSDAAGLVDAAVDKLVQGLREQRGALAKGTEDTESLRVELRSYRDILDRLLGL